MKPLAIIEAKRWKDTKTGATCSMYGVRPYEAETWVLEKVGYTVRNDNGTVGNGRVPFKTLEEIQAKYPNLPLEAQS